MLGQPPHERLSAMASSAAPPISWKALLVEVGLIVLGLSLALFVNEWREGLEDEARAEAALKSISSEIKGNQAFLQERLPYYRALADTIRVIVEAEGREAPVRALPNWRGLQPPLLRSSSFEAALATQALVPLDYQQVDLLSQVYAFQDIYRVMIENYIDTFISGNIETMADLGNAFEDLASLGGEVVTAYDQGLALIPEPLRDAEVPQIVNMR